MKLTGEVRREREGGAATTSTQERQVINAAEFDGDVKTKSSMNAA